MLGALPRITSQGEQLITQTADFIFRDEPTSMVHPDLERESCFPDGVAVPVHELPTEERHDAVVRCLTRSMHLVVIDSFLSADSRGYHASQVASPVAYRDLYLAGKKLEKLSKYGPTIRTADVEASEVHPHAVSYSLFNTYHDFVAQRDPQLIKQVIKRLKYAEPKLAEGETEEQRRAQRTYEQQMKQQRWRYVRPLAVAAASGFMLFNSFQDSQAAREVNPAAIENLEAERTDASPARVEQIDAEILELEVQMDGGLGFWLFVTGVAAGRAGFNHITRPRRP